MGTPLVRRLPGCCRQVAAREPYIYVSQNLKSVWQCGWDVKIRDCFFSSSFAPFVRLKSFLSLLVSVTNLETSPFCLKGVECAVFLTRRGLCPSAMREVAVEHEAPPAPSTSNASMSPVWWPGRWNEVQVPDAAKLMLAGGVSGVLAKTATAPLGRLTILYQVGMLTSLFVRR